MMMHSRLVVAMAALASSFDRAWSIGEEFPIYPEQFVVKTTEYSSDGEQVVNQTLAWDLTVRRTHMKAEGILVGGGDLEQIYRCDVDPGFFLQDSSSDPQQVRLP